MKTDELKSLLLKEAHEKGICREGYEQLGACRDLGAVLDFFTANPDWCLERAFPSWEVLDYLRDNHPEELERHGVYIKRTFHGEVLKDRQVYVFINCNGDVSTGLNIEKSIIPMMYFARGCHMTVYRSDEDSGYGDPPVVPLYIARSHPLYEDNTVAGGLPFETAWFKRHYIRPVEP